MPQPHGRSIATNLIFNFASESIDQLLLVRLDVADSVTYSLNLLSVCIGNLKIESLLELHDKLYLIQRVCTKVRSEASLCYNL